VDPDDSVLGHGVHGAATSACAGVEPIGLEKEPNGNDVALHAIWFGTVRDYELLL
jgi:hypothetical protein